MNWYYRSSPVAGVRDLLEGDVRTVTGELLVDARADLGEGPVWDGASARLLWVDILPGVLHRCDADGGGDEAWVHGPTIGAAAPRDAGGHVLAAGDGFTFLDGDGVVEGHIEVEGDRPSNRMNDGACDAAGRFWAGSMVDGEVSHGDGPDGVLYRLDPDRTVHPLLRGVTISNGIGWSPDGRWMYYIDSPTGGVDRFAFDGVAGTLGQRRRLVDVPADVGTPDGLTVDATGSVWVAIWGAGQVRRYTPAGDLDTIVEVPATLTTSCAFGGPDLDRLYITTARFALTQDEQADQPHAGGVFVVDAGVAGLPSHRFAG